jgi:UDP-N-acetylglucosamine diphosphorylase / glucose-1-phosphate thymidylyltransferase / UDP-N-acetylgalactosamine diphosphorylase / glucosamine-1-phosphate N-acetyltransferase / galactosamine-1-phosphate N-acetyltransferase
MLYLLEPETPGPEWEPFAGVRPLSELRAGAWRIRERWEGALRMESAAIVGGRAQGFIELDAPDTRLLGPIEGPAVVALSTFAPSGVAPEVEPTTRRLAHKGTTVAWIVPRGETWSGPHTDGPAQEVDGLPLRGVFDLITAMETFLEADCSDFLAGGQPEPVPAGSIVLGDPRNVIIRGALVEPGVVFDVRHGTIVLEEGAEVRHGTRLEGPLYAGQFTHVLGGFIRSSVFGPRCNVRGEIASSIFTGYSNKGHDGFVGHSVLGQWVNLGAGTTTSNLKNTYGLVRLSVRGHSIETGRPNVGSLIGDHAKTAIGTMLPTGTVIGAGASVFGGNQMPKYVPPMAWGVEGGQSLDEEGFLKIAGRVMPRRMVEFTDARRDSLRKTYRRLRPTA